MVRLLLAALLTVAASNGVSAQEPATAFEGKWQLESAILAGQNFAQTTGDLVMEIKGGRYTVTSNGEVKDQGKIEFNDNAKPTQVTITSDNQGAPQIIGIGKIEEKKAIFALRIDGSDKRPTSFEADAEDGTLMVSTYKRPTP